MKLNRKALRKMILKEIKGLTSFDALPGDTDYSQSKMYGGDEHTSMGMDRLSTIEYIESVCRQMGFDMSQIRVHHHPDSSTVNCGGDMIADVGDDGKAMTHKNTHRGSFTPRHFAQLEKVLASMGYLY